MLMQRTNYSFQGQNIFIGIDVHLKSWKVAIITERGCKEQFSQTSDAEVLSSHLKKKYPDGTYYSVYESGFCGFSAHHSLTKFGINNIIVNAADVPSTQKEKLNKTDKVDAMKLAVSLKNGMLQGIYIVSQKALSFRDQVRYRSALIKDNNRWKSRIKHYLYCHGIKYPEVFQSKGSHWSNNFIEWLRQVATELCDGQNALNSYIESYLQLKTQLAVTNKNLLQLSRTEAYAKDMELLLSIPGIGRVTAMAFLSEIEDIKRFKNERVFASFIGIVPTIHSSGETEIIGNMTFRGNNHLRVKLIESSWVAVRVDTALSACFGMLCQRMKPNDAIIRIARKLSNRILTILKTKVRYVNERNSQQK